MRRLLLASSSPYRRDLLSRLQLPFDCSAPEIDETAHANESAEQLVRRLAEAKSRALAPSHPDHLIIGSDQVAVQGGEILGKPHTLERAMAQLKACSGHSVSFLTGLALRDSRRGRLQVDCVPCTVQMRALDEAR